MSSHATCSKHNSKAVSQQDAESITADVPAHAQPGLLQTHSGLSGFSPRASLCLSFEVPEAWSKKFANIRWRQMKCHCMQQWVKALEADCKARQLIHVIWAVNDLVTICSTWMYQLVLASSAMMAFCCWNSWQLEYLKGEALNGKTHMARPWWQNLVFCQSVQLILQRFQAGVWSQIMHFESLQGWSDPQWLRRANACRITLQTCQS